MEEAEGEFVGGMSGIPSDEGREERTDRGVREAEGEREFGGVGGKCSRRLGVGEGVHVGRIREIGLQAVIGGR